MELISIIIPFYNASEHIKSCLELMRNQTYENIEIICVDDGSTDNTLYLLEEESKKDNRITILKKPNGGVSSARNCGVSSARGQYICFVDCDDKVSKQFCAKLLENIKKEKSIMSMCSYIVSECSNGQIMHKRKVSLAGNDDSDEETLYLDGFLNPLWNKIFCADLARKVCFDTRMSAGEDLAYVLEYLSQGGKISYIDEPLYEYIHYGDAEKQRRYSALELDNNILMLSYIMKHLDYKRMINFLDGRLISSARNTHVACKKKSLSKTIHDSSEATHLLSFKTSNIRLEIYRTLIIHQREKILCLLLDIENFIIGVKRCLWQ